MTNRSPAIATFERAVAPPMAAARTPGLAIAVTDRERTLYVGTFGLAEIAGNTPVTEATRFEIGSIGKSFAADVLLALAAEGRVDLHAPVSTYLPWLQIRGGFAPITLHHLLTHTAGISAGVDGSPDAVVEALTLAELGAATPPGERFHYSNGGYKILGLVIEAITGQSSAENNAARILAPLGMTSSSATITNADRPSLAVGYTGLYDDRPMHPNHPLVPATWLETDTADGAIIATAGDLAIYARMLLNRGAYPGGRIYPEESFQTKISAGAANERGDAYGYGIAIRQIDGRALVGHSGGMVGYLAGMVADLDAGVAAVVFVNGPGTPNLLARYAVAVFRAARDGFAPPDPPKIADGDPTPISGTFYRDGDESSAPLTFAPDGEGVVLHHNGRSIPLHPYGEDAFISDHPDWDRFVVGFERDDNGNLVAMSHGGDWFAIAGTAPPPAPSSPPEWDAFTGHYRSHNPWVPNFRVVRRRGELRLMFPAAPDGFDDDQPLIPIPGTDLFRAGADPGSPERVSFGTIVNGKARAAWLSGAPYVRDFTP